MKFANSKKRIIQESAKGKMFVKTEKGTKSYNPTAAFKVLNNGSMVKLTAANKKNVPTAIRSSKLNKAPAGMRTKARAAAKKAVRKVFPKPRGAPRGPRGPREGALLRKMNTESRAMNMKKRMQGPKKRVGRPPKSNSAVQGNQFRQIFKTPTKPRRAAASKLKRNSNMLTPEEAELYRIIFGTPTKGRPSKMAAPFRASQRAAAKKPKAPKKTPKAKDPKRVAAGKKAAATRKLKAMGNNNPFNALR